MPYWSNSLCLIFGIHTRMSTVKNSGLDQYGTEPFEQQQFGTVGVEGVNYYTTAQHLSIDRSQI